MGQQLFSENASLLGVYQKNSGYRQMTLYELSPR